MPAASTLFTLLSRHKLAMSLLVGALFLTYLTFDNHGLWKMYQMSREIEEIESSIVALSLENEELQRQIAKLDGDPATLEMLIRSEFGYVRSDEVSFVFQR